MIYFISLLSSHPFWAPPRASRGSAIHVFLVYWVLVQALVVHKINSKYDISQLPSVFRRISLLLIQGLLQSVSNGSMINPEKCTAMWLVSFRGRKAFDLIDHSILVTN